MSSTGLPAGANGEDDRAVARVVGEHRAPGIAWSFWERVMAFNAVLRATRRRLEASGHRMVTAAQTNKATRET